MRYSLPLATIASFILLLLSAASNPALASDTAAIKQSYPEIHAAGFLTSGQPRRAQLETQGFVPASTVKIITAWLALEHWGPEHRFQTAFYLERKPTGNVLWVRGSGDPFLVADEIGLIAKQLKQRGLPPLASIGLDAGLFAKGLVLPGTGKSDNPYDAVPSALAANFNTIHVHKRGASIRSAEAETPLTATAQQIAAGLRNGKHRVNLGHDPAIAIQYFGELLRAMLLQQGLQTKNRIKQSPIPTQLLQQAPFYIHKNSRQLREVVKPMLQYSTNFVANQLLLMLAAEHSKQTATAQAVRQYLQTQLRKRGMQGAFNLADGAGLSRSNKLSPQQLVWVLEKYRPWKETLPEVAPGLFAKSGTLRGFSTLAGYSVNKGRWQPFALMIPKTISARRRNAIAIALTSNSD